MFKKENIIILKEQETIDSLFIKIGEKAVELGITDVAQDVTKALHVREKTGSTGFIEGFGIPHGKTDSIKEPAIIFIKALKEIEWETMDGANISNMFCLLIPETGGAEHLKMLTTISRKLMHEDFRANVKAATTAPTIAKIVMEVFNEV